MEIGCRWGKIANEHIRIGSHSYEKVKTFKYLGSLVTNKNFVQEDIKCRLKAGNSCYYSVHTLLSLKTFKYLGSLVTVRINLPLFSTVLPSNICCFCPVGLSLLYNIFNRSCRCWSYFCLLAWVVDSWLL